MIRSDGGAGTPPGGDSPVADAEGSRPRFLFPVGGDHSTELLRIVCDLVADAGGDLIVASPVVVPEQTPLEMPRLHREGRRRAVEFVLKAERQCRGSPHVERVVGVGHDWNGVVRNVVETRSISTLVAEDRPRSGVGSILGFDRVADAGPTDDCDTILVSRIERLEAIDSVLVAVGRGPHSGMAVDTGLALARQSAAPIELLHVHGGDEDGRTSGDAVLDRGMERIGDHGNAKRTLLEAREVPEAIVEYARPFDVTVLGAPRSGRLRRFVFGTTPDEVSARTEGTVLVTRRGGTEKSWPDRWI